MNNVKIIHLRNPMSRSPHTKIFKRFSVEKALDMLEE